MSTLTARPTAPRTSRPWIKRSLLGLLVVSALAVGGALALAPAAPALPKGATLVDVGGYKLDLLCQGKTSGPTVILESGNGETRLTWARVQPKVARFARVCAYDRAGYAWSEASPKPRTVSVMVDELHALLEGAGIEGPVVLVGHSLGGVLARQYAARYPAQVSGVVLVDSAHEAQFQRLPESVRAATVSGLGQLEQAEQMIRLGLSAVVAKMVPLEPRLPAAIAELDHTLMVSGPEQVKATRGELEELMKGTTPPVASLGALPMVVISRGMAQPGMDTDTSAQTERVWADLQLELTALSSRGRRVVALKSGHSVQLDQPELVIDAIREVRAAKR